MTIENKTVLLLETRMTGHRPSYLRRMTHLFIDRGFHVTIAMPAACFEHSVPSKLLETYSAEKIDAIHCPAMDRESYPTNPIKMLRNEYLCTRFYGFALKHAQHKRAIDIAVIGMFDDAAIYSGLIRLRLGNVPWLGIVMRQSFHFTSVGVIGRPESGLSSVKRSLFLRLLRLIRGSARVLTIDKSLVKYVIDKQPELEQSISYIPDPVDERGEVTRPELRSELEIPDEAIVILAYGSLRENKGIRLLLDIMHELPENVHVLLAGTQFPAIADYVNSEKNRPLLVSGRLHQVNRYIDVTEDANFFDMANIVWLAYREYYAMSAVLVQAAQYHRPIVVTRTGLVGWLAKDYGTGVLVDTNSYDDVSSKLQSMIENHFSVEPANYDALANAHSLQSFEQSLMSNVEAIVSRDS